MAEYNIGGVPETMIQTLYARAKESKKKNPKIYDEKAIEIVSKKEVLHNISFSLEKNNMLALVGPSGGGKSTVANLLARFWDIKSGSIKIRGTDIREVPLAELMDNISMVFQRVYLF